MGQRNRLTALKVQGIIKRGERGFYNDGAGLHLQISKWGTPSWVYRYTYRGTTRWMGLGSADDFTLAKAREQCGEQREKLKAKKDPLAERDEERLQARMEKARRCTFDEACDRFIAAHEPSWKNPRHRQQWHNSLQTYVRPILGHMPVSEIETGDVMRCLEPIWKTKTETASRVRGRIEKVMDWAKAHGYRDGENPAAWKGHLANLLPAKGKITKVQHHAAMPYAQVPGFMATLRNAQSVSARALEFTVLTGCRTSEVIDAKVHEFDLNKRVWEIPAARMKSGSPHTVPLTPRMVEILQDVANRHDRDYAFVNPQTGRNLSNMAMAEFLKAISPNVTVHGFRSSLRDWLAEQTSFSHDLCEMALAHAVKDGTVKAYKRSDLLEKRRALMGAWDQYCGTPRPACDVVPLRKAKA